MSSGDFDERLRGAMFAYLNRISEDGLRDVTTNELDAFEFEGTQIRLLQPMRGIRVVAGLPAALTIRTTFTSRPADRPYEDVEGPDGYFRYMWRGTDPNAHDNVALRVAMTERKPLAWFVGVASGRFSAIYPIWLVGEEPTERRFVLAFDEITRDNWTDPFQLEHPEDAALRREYAESTVRRRLHQPVFRQRVLAAYNSQCALCRLRHPELLDAAHIREDADGGQPVVPNGVAMCAIHHRAFDANVLGIRSDFVVQVRNDVMSETDGPTLLHALQGLNGTSLSLPTRRAAWPSTDLLEERFERFLAAS